MTKNGGGAGSGASPVAVTAANQLAAFRMLCISSGEKW